MRLSERSYPHPVVGNRDDVPSAGFQAVILGSCDRENFYIDVEVHCGSGAIAALVKDKKAAYVAHIECTNTMYREAIRFHEEKKTLVVPVSRLFGRFEVNVFVVALSGISSYSVHGAHEDYAGASFDLSEGDILAVGDGKYFDPEPEDALVRVGSIMAVEESKTTEDGPMAVVYTRDKIIIILSKKDFTAYKVLKGHEHLGSTLTTTIVLPVLVEALNLLKAKPEDAELLDLRWHDNLRRRLEKLGLLGKDFNALDVAQVLLEQPIKRALSAGRAYIEAGS